jgi:hypothetical protein
MAQKKPKLKRLPKSNNGVRRKRVSMGCYGYQREYLKAQAKAHGMSLSYYLNWREWKDWL